MSRYTIATERDTARIAAAVAPGLRGGLTIGLSGELGAGKTTFVRYLIAAAGGDTRAVSSPTYTLQHEYPLPNGLTVEHWDLYRLSVVPLELEERTSPQTVRLIEWPERCPEILPYLSCHMRFSHQGEMGEGQERILEISGDTAGELTSRLEIMKGKV
ncbi:MAG: tRNA ((37)-N6)-threonylcarbamoyltransferase complex ATPase subunit type 1 TsaE [Pseudomonadota bacterium]